MTKTKYKLTGCARFFIFFIFFAPIAYFGASYINGGDPVRDVQKIIERFTGADEEHRQDEYRDDVRDLERENQDLREENERLRKQLENLE